MYGDGVNSTQKTTNLTTTGRAAHPGLFMLDEYRPALPDGDGFMPSVVQPVLGAEDVGTDSDELGQNVRCVFLEELLLGGCLAEGQLGYQQLDGVLLHPVEANAVTRDRWAGLLASL